MKRTVVIAIMLMCSTFASAQYSYLYYHRVGDTIEQTPNNAYLEWWDWDGETSIKPLMEPTFRKITLQKNYTEAPLKILGLAAVMKSWLYVPDAGKPLDYYVQEYLYLYDANDSNFVKLAEIPWDPDDPHRQIHINYRWNSTTITECCGNVLYDTVLPLYEYYFVDPIYVNDSFYVGVSSFSFEEQYYSLTTRYNHIGMAGSTRAFCEDSTCQLPPCTWKFMWHNTSTWVYQNTSDIEIWGTRERIMVYPIIEVDTTVPPPDVCPDVIEGFSVAQLSDTCLVASWDAFPNTSEVQIIYGPITVAQSEWDTVSVFTGNVFYICGLDSAASHYGFRARAICQSAGDTLEWSALEWVPVEPSAGISAEPSSRLGRQVAIQPNPAKGNVHFRSSATMLRIEVYNPRGMLVYSEPASGYAADIDFSNMPDGTYIAVVTTTAGSTAKRFALVK